MQCVYVWRTRFYGVKDKKAKYLHKLRTAGTYKCVIKFMITLIFLQLPTLQDVPNGFRNISDTSNYFNYRL